MSIKSLLPSIWPSNNNAVDPFQALRQEIERAFDSLGRGLPSLNWPSNVAMPKVNITQVDTLVSVTAELPGVELKNVELLIEDDRLTIKGDKKVENEENGAEKHLYECSYGAFSRTIQLPFSVDPKTVEAVFKNGVLSVSIPVPANAQPKAQKVEIKTAA
jgi:HSP20 family protein